MTGAGGQLPRGFESRRTGEATLIAPADRMPALVARGLDRPEGWICETATPAAGTGRGATFRIALDGGRHVVVKQMRRGGVLGPLWRDRFPRGRRLIDNLRVPLEVLDRGVATPRPVALLLLSGPPGLCRAWLATEEIPGARDLGRRIGGPDPPSRAEIDAVVALVRRMHDRGIDHPDLNLGNLLLVDPGTDPPRAYVVDLDRVRIRPAPLAPAARMRALCRLERSAVKRFGERPVEAFDLRRRLYEAYAGGEPQWGRLTDRAERANRFWIVLHRLAWQRPTPREDRNRS